MRSFEIETKTNNATYYFYTKANNGKEALKNLIFVSVDFGQLMAKTESNNMKVKVKVI